MDLQQTQRRIENKQPDDSQDVGAGEPAGNMAAQASAWGNVARRVREETQQGAEAERELKRRKNAPGQ